MKHPILSRLLVLTLFGSLFLGSCSRRDSTSDKPDKEPSPHTSKPNAEQVLPPDKSAESTLSFELKLSILAEETKAGERPPATSHLRFAIKNTGKDILSGKTLLSQQPYIRILPQGVEKPIELAMPKKAFESMKLAPKQSHHWDYPITELIRQAKLDLYTIYRIAWTVSETRSNQLPLLIDIELDLWLGMSLLLVKKESPTPFLRFTITNFGKLPVDGKTLLVKQPHILISPPYPRGSIEFAIPKKILESIKLAPKLDSAKVAPEQSHHWDYPITELIRQAKLKKAGRYQFRFVIANHHTQDIRISIEDDHKETKP